MTKAEYDRDIKPAAVKLSNLCEEHELNHVIAVELGANIPSHVDKTQVVASYLSDGKSCLDPVIDYIDSGQALDTHNTCVV